MNPRKFRIGPGAASLMLLAVVLSMSVLGALALVSARNDLRLSNRRAAVIEQVYHLNDCAERRLMALDEILARIEASTEEEYLAAVRGALPEDMALTDRTIRWTEQSQDGRSLSCAVTLQPLGEFPRAVWTEHRLITEFEDTEFDESWN